MADDEIAKALYLAWYGEEDEWFWDNLDEGQKRFYRKKAERLLQNIPRATLSAPLTHDQASARVWAWFNKHDAPWSPSDATVSELIFDLGLGQENPEAQRDALMQMYVDYHAAEPDHDVYEHGYEFADEVLRTVQFSYLHGAPTPLSRDYTRPIGTPITADVLDLRDPDERES